MSKEDFKSFVRTKPDLANRVHDKEFSWQELYEAYEMYGENASFFKETPVPKSNLKTQPNKVNWPEFLSLMKNIDLDTLQKGVVGLQKAIRLIQDFSSNKEETPKSYEERPIYKYYED